MAIDRISSLIVSFSCKNHKVYVFTVESLLYSLKTSCLTMEKKEKKKDGK